MYSPTARLLTVLELLQSRKRISGNELARRLEVKKRTVRRYIVMLQDMGIPVEAERGPYGAYELRRGFKLPPLMFTDTEAIAVALSLLAIRQYNFPVDAAAVEGALAKTERVLPEKLLHQVRALQEAISFNISVPRGWLHDNVVSILSTAIHEQQQVHLSYQSWQGNPSERIFDPYGIVFNDGYWYSAGYCHLREDLRTFRLDRVESLNLLDNTFDCPENFDAMDYVLKSVSMLSDSGQIEVILHTTLEEAQRLITPTMGTLEEGDEGIIFRRSETQLDWIAHVLIHADFPITIVQSDVLRDCIRDIGLKALKIAGHETR